MGPYGSGKSTTALVIYRYLTNSLPKSLVQLLNKNGIRKISNPFSIGQAITITGRKISLERDIKEHLNIRTNVRKYIEESYLKKNKKLLLIIDEFGKYLEYNSDNPKSGDIYVLQELAELSHRSDGKFIIITIRHQAISAYFQGIRGSYLNEWRKIQGRFEDIVHYNSFTESIKIFQKAFYSLYGKKRIATPSSILSILKKNSQLGDAAQSDILKYCYPLHPLTVLIMISAYKTFAQNERSIFSFLQSERNRSLRHFITQGLDSSYEISHFYDYIDNNLKHFVNESDLSTEWQMIETALKNLSQVSGDLNKDKYHFYEKVIKTIGMLNLFGKDVGLQSNLSAIRSACYGNFHQKRSSTDISKIEFLNSKNIITFRKLNKTYHLWIGTDINIHELIEGEIYHQSTWLNLSTELQNHLPIEPIVARRHYVKTGTFRIADWKFISIDQLTLEHATEADGLLLCLVLDSSDSIKKVLKTLKEHSANKKTKYVLFQVDRQTEENIRTYVAISNLLNNNQEVAKDKYARSELKSLQFHYRQKLFNMMINQKGSKSNLYLLNDNRLDKVSWNQLRNNISDWFAQVYKYTPTIINELINKDKPSPSANIGIKKMFQSLLENSHLEYLGIIGNGPEKSIYINVLQSTGIHSLDKDGHYVIGQPTEPNLVRLWKKWDQLLSSSRYDGPRLSFTSLEIIAQDIPFGLKIGLARFLALMKIFSDLQHLSIYRKDLETGRFIFLPKIYTDTLDMMLKRPDLFEVKYYDIQGIHPVLFKRLYAILKGDSNDIISLLDVVKPLIEFVNRLTDHTKKTKKRLTKDAQKFVKIVMYATSPEDLINLDIPHALKLNPINAATTAEEIEIYVNKIENIYNELRNCDATINDEINKSLIHFWGLKPNNTFEKTRMQLQEIFTNKIVSYITDQRLKLFAQRVGDKDRKGVDWIQSISSPLVERMPDKWSDSDFASFIDQLRLMNLQIEQINSLLQSSQILDDAGEIRTEILETKMLDFISTLGHSPREIRIALARLLKKINNKEWREI